MINLMAMAELKQEGAYVEIYEAGERILPKINGRFTVYSLMPTYGKGDVAPASQPEAGRAAEIKTQVVWAAADADALRAIAEHTKQLAAPEKPKLLVPDRRVL